MAGHGWGTTGSVARLLFAEGWRFELHQAVRLLERMAREAVPVGEGTEPEREAVRFSSRVGLDFRDHVRTDPTFVATSSMVGLEANPARARCRLGWCPTVRFDELVALMVDADLAAEGARA